MHIFYLINQYPKNSHSFIRREIRSLDKNDVSVSRVSVRDTGQEIIDDADRLEYRKTKVLLSQPAVKFASSFIYFVLRNPANLIRGFARSMKIADGRLSEKVRHIAYFAEAVLLARWMLAEKADHLHAHFGTNSATVAMIASTLSNVPYSFTVHGPEEFDRPVALRLGEKIARAKFVAAVSSFGRSQLMRWADYDQWPKICVVHCGIDQSFYQDKETETPDTENLVCVGRLCEQKGQLLLVKAVKRLVDRRIPVHLTLAGDGEMRGEIERLIDHDDLGDHITITGWLDGPGVRGHILSARAMVLPSFAEGLPVVIMEAMALKRPVISTYVAGIPELVTDDTGWLVPAGDVDQLAEAMMLALQMPVAKLREMGERAHARVVERHDIDGQATILLNRMIEPADGH